MTERASSATGVPGRPPVRGVKRRGLTAVELLILFGLMVLLAMVVVPRMTRGAAAEKRAELVGRLATLRNAIDLYAAEHRGDFPSVERFAEQLTGRPHSGDEAETEAEPSGDEPSAEQAYLERIPALPLGRHEGMNGVVDGSIGRPGDRPGGWFYNPNNGRIRANLPDRATDPRGIPYNRY